MDYKIQRIDYPDGRYDLFGKKDDKNHGPWQTFYKNGKPHINRTFVNGREDGHSTTHKENGQLLDEKFYRYGELHGIWRQWSETGELIHSAEFEYGDSIDRKLPLSGELEVLLDQIRRIPPEVAAEKHDALIPELARYSAMVVEAREKEVSELPASWLGNITHLGDGEEWPIVDSQPMVPLLQIRTSELPIKLNCLDDIEVISIFGPHEFPLENGIEELEIKVYGKNDKLMPVVAPKGCFRRKPVKISFNKVLEYPSKNDLAPGLKIYLEDNNPESTILEHETEISTKVGGWPAWLQFTRLHGQGEWVLQLDSCDFEDWDAGDATVFYCFYNPVNKLWWSSAEMC
jgi:hypothetical protein